MLLALALQGAFAAAVVAQPVVMQSECRATEAGKPGGFIFEAISTDGKWTNRIAPLPGSDFPDKLLVMTEPEFKILPTPRGTRSIWNTGNVEIEGFRYHFFALAEIIDKEVGEFSVDLSKNELGPTGKNLVFMKTKCKFTNRNTTEQAGKK